MITFIEDKHLYLNDRQEQYTSVTTILKQFEPKKDWDKIKKNYAKKNKLSVDQVTEMWDKAKNDACTKGTAYHKYRELELVANHSYDNLIVRPSYCIGGEKSSISISKIEDGIYPELIIWLDSARIAGQADIIIVKDGYIHIKDYKTNKKIDKEGFKNWEGKQEMLVAPLQHLPSCNYSIYSLQLSMYMYMLLRHNPHLRAGSMELLHVQFEKDDNDPGVETVKDVLSIPVNYMKIEVQNIIQFLKHKR